MTDEGCSDHSLKRLVKTYDLGGVDFLLTFQTLSFRKISHNSNMEDTQHFAKFRFGVPDFSVPPEDRSLFSFPATTKVVHERIELHDFRTSTEVTKGPEGLDVQGFTYINHRSVLHNSDQWFDSVRDAYIPEVEDLICKVTGAKRAIVNNVAFRRKLAADQEDPTFYYKRGHPLDQALSEIPKDVALGENFPVSNLIH